MTGVRFGNNPDLSEYLLSWNIELKQDMGLSQGARHSRALGWGPVPVADLESHTLKRLRNPVSIHDLTSPAAFCGLSPRLQDSHLLSQQDRDWDLVDHLPSRGSMMQKGKREGARKGFFTILPRAVLANILLRTWPFLLGA